MRNACIIQKDREQEINGQRSDSHRGATGLYLSTSRKMASTKGNKGRSSIVGNLPWPTTASICACAFSCAAGFTTIMRKKVSRTELDWFILLVVMITTQTWRHERSLMQLIKRTSEVMNLARHLSGIPKNALPDASLSAFIHDSSGRIPFSSMCRSALCTIDGAVVPLG